MNSDLAVVVIGRNEGERLQRCLHSIQRQADQVVYVDSGSSDGSVTHARTTGAEIVALDMSMPFSAARARNEGFDRALQRWSEIKFVQFVDGDCELNCEWLVFGRKFFDAHPSCAIAAGRVKERYPERSIYNRLCDIEWDTPVGESDACGGIFMVRVSAFRQGEGFNPAVIAGEEPELCYRLKNMGWQIYRLDHPMALHDAAISHFSQWWKRTARSGHAYAQGFALHRVDGQGYCLRDSLRIWLWSCLLPIGILFSGWAVHPMAALLLIIYPVQIGRITIDVHRQVENWHHALAYALFNMLGKLPQLFGQLLFLKRNMKENYYFTIEYK